MKNIPQEVKNIVIAEITNISHNILYHFINKETFENYLVDYSHIAYVDNNCDITSSSESILLFVSFKSDMMKKDCFKFLELNELLELI
jgi:hypothetical protein